MELLPVSLTTIDSRQSKCRQVLENLLYQQTVKPKEIHLWISKEPYLFDKGIHVLEPFLTEFIEKNQEIKLHWTKNIGPYRKLLPFAQMFPNSPVLIIDDDELHKPNFYESACKLWKEKQCCIAFRASFFRPNNDYCKNELVFDKNQIDIFHKGNGGVVYHTSWFQDDSFFDSKLYESCCKTNDDIWFNLWRIKKNIYCYVSSSLYISKSLVSDIKLWSTNATANDGMIKKTMETLQILL